MRAWRVYSVGGMRLDEVPYPEPKAGWVTIKTRVVQPSVTEAIRARGGATMDSDAVRKLIEERAPVQLFGHEFCGEVVELSEGVTSLKVGDRVAGMAVLPCHKCVLCRAGFEYRCRKGPAIGREIPGALSDYTTLPAEALVVLPPEVNDNEGACIQPLSSAVCDIAEARIQVGDTVAIMGQGVMGLYLVQLAKISGAGTVIGVDIKKGNLRLSKELGSDYQIDATEVDPVTVANELTGGFGADIVFECAGGSPAEGLAGTKTLNQAFDIATDGGKVMQVAMFGGALQFNPDVLRKKSITYVFPKTVTPKLLQHTVRLAATGQVNLSPLITHVLHGLEKVPESFEITSNKSRYGAINPAQVVVSQP